MASNHANIWRLSDGDGASDKTNWKICDHLPPGQLSNTNRPPANTYLTDRVFQVVTESAISGRKKGTWWSGDFDINGKPRVSRANRSAAVLDQATGQAATISLPDGKQIALVGDPNWSAPPSPTASLPKSRPVSGEVKKEANPAGQQSSPTCPVFSIGGATQPSQRSRGWRDSDVSMANTKNTELEANPQRHVTSSDSEVADPKAQIASLESQTEMLQGQLRTVEIAKQDYEAQATRQAYQVEQLQGEVEQSKIEIEKLKDAARCLLRQVQILGAGLVKEANGHDAARRESTGLVIVANEAVNALALDDATLHDLAERANTSKGGDMDTAEDEHPEIIELSDDTTSQSSSSTITRSSPQLEDVEAYFAIAGMRAGEPIFLSNDGIGFVMPPSEYGPIWQRIQNQLTLADSEAVDEETAG